MEKLEIGDMYLKCKNLRNKKNDSINYSTGGSKNSDFDFSF